MCLATKPTARLVPLPPYAAPLTLALQELVAESLGKVVAAELPKWVKLAKDANIQAD